MIDEAFVRLAHDFIIDDILVGKYLLKATNNDTRAISINRCCSSRSACIVDFKQELPQWLLINRK